MDAMICLFEHRIFGTLAMCNGHFNPKSFVQMSSCMMAWL